MSVESALPEGVLQAVATVIASRAQQTPTA